jgi:hypothetical protein
MPRHAGARCGLPSIVSMTGGARCLWRVSLVTSALYVDGEFRFFQHPIHFAGGPFVVARPVLVSNKKLVNGFT